VALLCLRTRLRARNPTFDPEQNAILGCFTEYKVVTVDVKLWIKFK